MQGQQQETIKFRSGGGILMVLGLFFGGIPLMMLIAMLADGEAQHQGLFPFLFLGAFIAIGASLALGRKGVDLDSRRSTITSWWGLVGLPFKSTLRQFDEFEKVRLYTRVIRSNNSSRTVYPVELVAKSGESLKVIEPGTYAQGRVEAEKVAKFLDFGMLDEGGEVAVFREAGTLDESVRDRLRRTGQTVEPSAAPEGCRIVMDIGADEVSFQFPEANLTPGAFLSGVGVIVVLIGLFGFLAGPGVLVLYALAIPAAYSSFREMTGLHRLSIDRTKLKLVVTAANGSSSKEIPLDELEELEISPHGNRLMARSDKLTFTAGSRISSDEANWIRDTLHFAMSKE